MPVCNLLRWHSNCSSTVEFKEPTAWGHGVWYDRDRPLGLDWLKGLHFSYWRGPTNAWDAIFQRYDRLRASRAQGSAYDPTSRQRVANGSVEQFWNQEKFKENILLFSQIQKISSSKVGRHRIPLGRVITTLWWPHGRDSPAYQSELLRTFSFSHPPTRVCHSPLFFGDWRGFYSQVGFIEIG
jgi:hypothetical protein